MGSKENSAVEQIVLLIHGIRTQADWQEMVAEVLEENNKIVVKLIKYGYFDAFRFWLPFTRSGPINYVEKQIEIIKSLHPNAKLSIIVHSFGSYIIGKILERHYDLNIEKLILCGSVLETTYRWEDILNRRNIKEDNVINECGKKDIWPVLAKATSWGYGVSGTHGFGNVIVKDRFHDATHGQYFQKKFVSKYWKPFIYDSEYKRTSFETDRPTTPWWLSLLGILPIKSMLMLVVLYFAIIGIIFDPGVERLNIKNGSATKVMTWNGIVLRLTSATNYQSGSAFSLNKVSVAKFSTHFKFKMTNLGNGGADGITFIIQPNSSNELGDKGGGIGYRGIQNSVGVEFDTWNNGPECNDSDDNHIGININGNFNGPVYSVDTPFQNGDLWYVWIDYDGTKMEVRANTTGIRPEAPLLTRAFDIPKLLGGISEAYIGFSAATGNAYENHDIMSLTYGNSYSRIK